MEPEAILFTFLHSLWIGAVLAIFAYLVLFFTNKTHASLRYNLLTACLFLFVIAIGFVFYVEVSTTQSIVQISGVNDQALSEQLGTISGLEGSFWQRTVILSGFYNQLMYFISWLSHHASAVISIWFFIVCIKGIRFSSALRNIHHMKHRNIVSAGSFWEDRVTELSLKLGIKGKVRIVQSAIAKTPMVIGYIKPMILIPIGVLTTLPVEQVESILYHELAHIKRRDYLVNIIQSLLEIIFFFNPAVLWISNLVKIERENCCDDLAIQKINSRTDYIRALVSCVELSHQSSPALAMKFSDDKNYLLKRVNRILLKQGEVFSKIEKAFLTIGVISLLLLTFAFQESKTPAFEEGVFTSLNDDTESSEGKYLTFTGITAEELSEEEGKNIEHTLIEIISDLTEDELITDTEQLTYMLDEETFIVNNKSQPSDIHRKYKDKFIKQQDWIISYNYKMKL